MHPCMGMSSIQSFDNIGLAILTLFRVSTGDAWSAIMSDCMQQSEPFCDITNTCTENCCPVEWIVPIYFLSFVLLIQYILLNVVVVSLTYLFICNHA